MTETPAATQNGQDAAAQPRSGYLPVLPAGWEYVVELVGPAGSIRVTPQYDPLTPAAPPTYRVVVRSGDAEKNFTAATLREAVKSAADAARALTAIAEHEAKAAEAKQKLLDTIGPDQAAAPEPPKAGKSAASKPDAEKATPTSER